MTSISKQSICLANAVLGIAVSLAQASTRLNVGAQRWMDSATTGRADVLFLGDSIVSYGVGGWSTGLAQAAQKTIGLSGSGLLMAPLDSGLTGANYTGARIWSSPATDSSSFGVASLSPSSKSYDVETGFGFVGTGVDAVSLDAAQRTDWHVFASGRSGSAQLQARQGRRVVATSSELITQTTSVQPVGLNPNGLSDQVFHFEGTTVPGDLTTYAFTAASPDVTVHYAKLTQPDSTGIAVSGWGFSGGTTRSFRDLYYNHPRFTTEGRTAFYQSIVAGNSGKLNVAISFGVNDALLTPADQYAESIRGLIADVRRDWQTAGLSATDLTFSLMSAYQVNQAGYPSDAYYRLVAYRNELDAIASTDEQISFIDIWSAGPTWQEAMANHYLADNVHPSELGSAVYGDVLLGQYRPTAGDANIDGSVNFEDLLTLAQHYGDASDVTWNDGDFNRDNAVGFDDLLDIAQRYGTSPGSVPAPIAADWQLASALVPEPQCLVIILVFAARRRR